MVLDEYTKEKSWLEDYAKMHDIRDLNSEDLLKLFEKPYIISEILHAFNLTEKELKQIRKEKNITNIYLEGAIRNIDAILYYLDSKNRYISSKIRNRIVKILIPALSNPYNNSHYYIKQLSLIDFSRDYVNNDIIKRNIDIDYRLNRISHILPNIDLLVDEFLREEKEKLLNYNSKKLYNELLTQKENGVKFTKEDLTYDVLYELSVIEGISGSLIGMIFDMDKNQVRNLRIKHNLSNVYKTKVLDYPEFLIYYMEDRGKREANVSNYELEKSLYEYIKNEYETKESIEDNTDNFADTVLINIDGEDMEFNFEVSEDAYSIKIPSSHRKRMTGSHHNYTKENETKNKHGKIGEKIALEYEKKRLKKLGLEEYIDQVKLIAQIDENTTFDGMGYDLVSINEEREPIFIEVKTSFGKKDKPFFISKGEMDLMKGYVEEFDCKHCFIYYILVNDNFATIKEINCDDFSKYKLDPVLYKITETNTTI